MVLDIIFIAGGIVALYLGGEWLVRSSSRLALSFSISPLIVAVTIVAVGTSAPELLVNLVSAAQGSQTLGVGNVIGSNIANIGLILGCAGLISAIAVKRILIRREIPIMIGATVLTAVLAIDGTLSQIDGIILLVGFIAFTVYFYWVGTQEHHAREAEMAVTGEYNPGKDVNKLLESGILILGIAALVLGANLLVQGAVSIATMLGISEMVVGITVVAFGTSLPELAASVSAARHKEGDIAIGNVIGSNIANLLLILGATAFVAPITLNDASGYIPFTTIFSFIVVIVFSLLLFPFAINGVIDRRESFILLLAYAGFIVLQIFISVS